MWYFLLLPGEDALFETAENPSLIRRIAAGFIELTKASLRPLRYKAVRLRFLRDCVLFYMLMVLLLHFVGYRRWYPEFHRVRETFLNGTGSASCHGWAVQGEPPQWSISQNGWKQRS
jgi:hypothetical protein